jgi:hypothetical protein
VALVVAFGLVGCAGPLEDAGSFDLVESELIRGAWANPLDRVLYPDESAAAMIWQAGEAAIAECMAERGFEYEGGAFPQSFPREQAQYVYGGTDAASAKTNGLKSAIWMEAVRRSSQGSPTPSEGYLAALNGAAAQEVRDSNGVVVGAYDPESCLGTALDTVTPKWAEMDGLRSQAGEVLLAAAEVEGSKVVRDGFADWSECMAAAGYDYADPWSMDDDFPGDSPTEPEKELAVASAECMHSSGLLRAWSKARSEATWKELQDTYPDLLSRWDALFVETVAHVESLGAIG